MHTCCTSRWTGRIQRQSRPGLGKFVLGKGTVERGEADGDQVGQDPRVRANAGRPVELPHQVLHGRLAVVLPVQSAEVVLDQQRRGSPGPASSCTGACQSPRCA